MSTDRRDVVYGTLGLMVLKTLQALGPLHGYRIARRIEQISGNQLALNQGTLYPALLKLLNKLAGSPPRGGSPESGTAREGVRADEWPGARGKCAPRKVAWQHATGIVARFFNIQEDATWRSLRVFLFGA